MSLATEYPAPTFTSSPGPRAGQLKSGKFRAIMHEHKRMPLREYHLRDESDHHKTRYSHASIRREEYFVCFNFHRTSSRARCEQEEVARIQITSSDSRGWSWIYCGGDAYVHGLRCPWMLLSGQRKNESKRECVGCYENCGTRSDVAFCHVCMEHSSDSSDWSNNINSQNVHPTSSMYIPMASTLSHFQFHACPQRCMRLCSSVLVGRAVVVSFIQYTRNLISHGN